MPRPCPECPFRRDGHGGTPVRLVQPRIHEIVRSVAPADGQGTTFPCHKTVIHGDRDLRAELQCAGALIFAYKQGAATQHTRIMERLGVIDPALATGDHPEIFDDEDEMLATALDLRDRSPPILPVARMSATTDLSPDSTSHRRNPVTAIAPVTTRMVRLSELQLEAPNWTNPRQFSGMKAADLTALGESIERDGIKTPLRVQQVLAAEGEIILLVIDGQRRKLAADHIGLKGSTPIPVIDVSPDPIEMTEDEADRLLDDALTTLDREGISSYELVDVAARLKARGKTLDYIAPRIRRSPSWVSKMLKAQGHASEVLLAKWKRGDVTDEQFKELAEVREPEAQRAAVEAVVEARKAGDKTEARVRSKETLATARASDDRKAPACEPGTQQGLRLVSPDPTTISGGSASADASTRDAPKPPPMRARAALEDVLALSAKRPPTDDYVKGILHGVEFALGKIDADGFSRAWGKYTERVAGAKPARKAKETKLGARARGAQATRKQRPAKPAKKAPASKAARKAKK